MKNRFVNLTLCEERKLVKSNLFRICFLLLFLANLVILLVYDNSDSFDKVSYRQFKHNYKQYGNSEEKRLVEAKEKCVKKFVMKSYRDELDIEKGGTGAFKTSYDIAKEAGYTDDWYKNVKDEYLSGKHLDYDTTLDQESMFLGTVYEEIRQDLEYTAHLHIIQTKLENSMEIKVFQNEQSAFSKKSLKKAYSDYKDMEEVKPCFAGTRGLSKVLGNSLFDICPCVMLLIVCILLFMEDKKNGIIKLLRSTGNGREVLYISKIVVLLQVSFVIVTIYWGSIFLYVWKSYGEVLMDAPLQSIIGFQDCTIKGNIGYYLFSYLIQKVFIVFIIGVLCSLIAILSNNYVTYFLVSSIIFTVSLCSLKLIPQYTCFSIFRNLNFIYCLKVAPLCSNYRNLNFFGKPVAQLEGYFLVLVCIGVLLILVSIHCYQESEQLFGSTRIQYTMNIWKRRSKVNVSIFCYEIYKILIGNRVLIVLIGIMVASWSFTLKQPHYLNENEYYYQKYMKCLEGEVTEKKRDYINKEAKKIENIEKRIQEVKDSYNNGEISEEEMNELIGHLELQIKGKNAFSVVQSRLDYIDSDKAGKYTFVYEDGWNQVFGLCEDGRKRDMKSTLLCIFTLIVCLGGIVTSDYEIGMDRLQKVSKNGRTYLDISKLVLSFLITFFTVIIVYANDFIFAARKYGIHSLFENARSIPELANVVGSNASLFPIYMYSVFDKNVRIFNYFDSNVYNCKNNKKHNKDLFNFYFTFWLSYCFKPF